MVFNIKFIPVELHIPEENKGADCEGNNGIWLASLTPMQIPLVMAQSENKIKTMF